MCIRDSARECEMRQLVSAMHAAMRSGRKLFGRVLTSLSCFFEAIDTDGDGRVSMQELSAALRRLGLGLRGSQIDDLMAYFDEDGGGDIDFHEFSALMQRYSPTNENRATYRAAKVKARVKQTVDEAAQQQHRASEHARECEMRRLVSAMHAAMRSGRKLFGQTIHSLEGFYKMVDTDGDGRVSMQELSAALRRLGLGLRGSQIDDLMAYFDEDGGGDIDFHEFETLLERYEPKYAAPRARDTPWLLARRENPTADVITERMVREAKAKLAEYESAVRETRQLQGQVQTTNREYGCSYALSSSVRQQLVSWDGSSHQAGQAYFGGAQNTTP
eukprot:TRINITY_DN4872_c0_g1_i4.p1 TRINITY_DN4872_c0_g1~~TRINITY_DN4872_c0_g1_i4.p1  ORF type:complete len:331 (+),score=98.80 TRINITY_DN4872_c0_g1_i4:79-1071(+)